MLEQQLFANLVAAKQPSGRLHKGAIIGVGQVGMACAYSMLIQNTFDELVLTDVNQLKLEGEVMDLMHGIRGPSSNGTDSYARGQTVTNILCKL